MSLVRFAPPKPGDPDGTTLMMIPEAPDGFGFTDGFSRYPDWIVPEGAAPSATGSAPGTTEASLLTVATPDAGPVIAETLPAPLDLGEDGCAFHEFDWQVPDHGHEAERADFVTTGRKWGPSGTFGTSGGTVTWSLTPAGVRDIFGGFGGTSVTLSNFLGFDPVGILNQAFAAWSAIANITFVQVGDGGGNSGSGTTGDIRIAGGSIDGRSNVLAYAYFPASSPAGGDMVFDSGEGGFWTPSSFLTVATHEIGHAIGLNHTSVANQLMNPFYNPSIRTPQSDDAAGARFIYGAAGAPPPVDEWRDAITDGSLPFGRAAPGGMIGRGNVETAGDHDIFAVNLLAGRTYTFDLRGAAGGGGTLPDAFLSLRNGSGSVLVSDDDSGAGADSRFTFTPSVSNEYYLDAGAFANASTGTYELEMGIVSGGGFGLPLLRLAAFGSAPSAGGWRSDDAFPRQLADVNGDGREDIVAFGSGGVSVALATGGGGFAAPSVVLSAFGAGEAAGGWSSDDRFIRELGDVNGDGRADIVGFGYAGVSVSLATGGDSFGAPTFVLAEFGSDATGGGWASNGRYKREVADVNGDGRADIVGFGHAGVTVALGTSGGGFAAPSLVLGAFGTSDAAGGWADDDRYPRELGDVNGDGRADIVGFGEAGATVALGTASGAFGNPTLALATFGTATGWTSDARLPRELGDVNGDGRDDIVGFGPYGVFVALGTPAGGFAGPTFEQTAFGPMPSAGGWASEDAYPREVGDVNGDGRDDIVGFGIEGTVVALSNGLF